MKRRLKDVISDFKREYRKMFGSAPQKVWSEWSGYLQYMLKGKEYLVAINETDFCVFYDDEFQYRIPKNT